MTDEILGLIERLESLSVGGKQLGLGVTHMNTINEAIVKLAHMDARITQLQGRVEQERAKVERRAHGQH